MRHGVIDGVNLAGAEIPHFPAPVLGISANGFKSVVDIEKEKLEQEAKEDAANPMKTLWVKVLKDRLTGDGGAGFFESSLKDSLLPGPATPVGWSPENA